MDIIIVKQGDTVYSIAEEYGLDVSKIISDNGLDESGYLVVGQSLVLVFPSEVALINRGSTVEDIAESNNISTRTVFRNNFFLLGNNDIPPRSTVVLDYEETPRTDKIIGGYAYDFISDELLRSVISYMTYLMPFTYGFTEDGELISPEDERLISIAYESGAKPLMHLSTLTPDGSFDSQSPVRIFADSTALENLYENILNTVIEKGYYGVDVDFEFLPASERENYVRFIENLTRRLNDIGLITVVALPPKTSDDQQGLLYEGIDYEGLGNAANYAFLMTYEWGYRFGPPLPIAPVNSVNRVIEYALSRIPNEKILLGISNYGYDWTLPFIRGESDAPSISTAEALSIARRYGAEIEFDVFEQAPFFYYTDESGQEHLVYFEDARSFYAKTLLINEYSLAGGFIWDLMRENPQGYVTLNSVFEIE